MPAYQLCSERLERAAAAKGDLSGYAIAKRTGLNQTTVSRIRRGVVQPATRTLKALATAYDLTVDELIVDASEVAA